MAEKIKTLLNSECAHTVEDIIKEKDDDAFKALLGIVNEANKNEPQLHKAIYILGRWKNDAAVKPIVNAMPMLDEIGRSSAVDALSLLGGSAALDAIVELAKDKSPIVRKFVGIKLSRFKNEKALDCLKEISSKDEIDFVRVAALKSLNK